MLLRVSGVAARGIGRRQQPFGDVVANGPGRDIGLARELVERERRRIVGVGSLVGMTTGHCDGPPLVGMAQWIRARCYVDKNNVTVSRYGVNIIRDTPLDNHWRTEP